MQVLAFVGPSGTGKSYHASGLAWDVQADVVIDDGLLIRDGHIVAGKSAKREGTRVGALRRAFFLDPKQASEVRQKLMEIAPERVLVLATSTGMADRITRALGLPLPERYISIEEVASPEDIRQATWARRQEGKHVIPAPTLEVKKGFSGYLVDPLRVLLRSRKSGSDMRLEVEKSLVRPTFSSLGKFYISQAVVVAIVARASRQVQGVNRVLRARVDIKPEGVVVNVDLALDRVSGLRRVMPAVQRRIAEELEHMTALNVLAINVVARRLILGVSV